MLHRRLRIILSLALLLALSLPAMVTAALAVHEAAHHRQGTRTDAYLFAVVHGHHHDQDIEAHDHEAVVTKTRAGSTAERSATLSMRSDRCVHTSLGTVRSAADGRLLEPPRSSDLCIWLL